MSIYSRHIQRINTLILIGGFIAACGGETEEEETGLSDLISKRDSLKTELSEVNAKIAELDTVVVLTPLVTTSTVMRKRFVHKVEVQGGVESEKNAMVNAEASGIINKIHVREGQKISKGQALVTINSDILSSSIEEVKISLELAEYMLEKQQKLMDQGLGVEINYQQALNQKKALEKRLKTMRAQQGKTTVRAPFSGVVEDIVVSLGEVAAPQFPLMRIVNNDKVTISAALSENLLSKVREGTEVDLRIPSLNDTIIKSVVKSRGNYIDPVNRTFRVIVEINDNTELLPNQLAKVNVTDFVRDSALVINSQTILQDTKNRNYIYKLVDKKKKTYGVEKVYVKVHKRYKGEACVSPLGKSSLDADDIIVLEGAKGITPMDRVQILSK
ncbi:efflux RND transporter periplasmic adaptor subunit [Crocinitomix catalasitica]|nr:efflux RND transporter periplasmic adaptor subunit [Crocinitomix catalasitica]